MTLSPSAKMRGDELRTQLAALEEEQRVLLRALSSRDDTALHNLITTDQQLREVDRSLDALTSSLHMVGLSEQGSLRAALRMLRLQAHLSQDALSVSLDTWQSAVARSESERPSSPSPTADTLERWSSACGFELLYTFLNARSDWKHLTAKILLLATCHRANLAPVNHRSRTTLINRFLRDLVDLLGADCATCFMRDRSRNLLPLIGHTGVWQRAFLPAASMHTQTPMTYFSSNLTRPAFLDITADVKLRTGFTAREHIHSSIVVPLRDDNILFGLVFLNYRRPVEPCRGALDQLLVLGDTIPFISGTRDANSFTQNLTLNNLHNASRDAAKQAFVALLSGSTERPFDLLMKRARDTTKELDYEYFMYTIEGRQATLSGSSLKSITNSSLGPSEETIARVATDVHTLPHMSVARGVPRLIDIDHPHQLLEMEGSELAVRVFDSHNDALGVIAAVSPRAPSDLLAEAHPVPGPPQELLREWIQIAAVLILAHKLVRSSDHNDLQSVTAEQAALRFLDLLSQTNAPATDTLNAFAELLRSTLGAISVGIWRVRDGHIVKQQSTYTLAPDVHSEDVDNAMWPRESGEGLTLSLVEQGRSYDNEDPAGDPNVNHLICNYVPADRWGALHGRSYRLNRSIKFDGYVWVWLDKTQQRSESHSKELVTTFANSIGAIVDLLGAPIDSPEDAPDAHVTRDCCGQ